MRKLHYVAMIGLATLLCGSFDASGQGLTVRPTVSDQPPENKQARKLSPKACTKLLTKAENSGKSMNVIIRRKMQLASRGCEF